MRAEKIQAFYTGLSGMERYFHVMQEEEFDSQQDMIISVIKALG